MSDLVRQRLLAADRLLIEKILSDPDEGWKEFLCAHESFIQRIIGRFDLSEEDREDVYQEVSHLLIKDDFKVLRAWDPGRSLLQNYLTVVVTHAVINFLRSRFHSYQKRKVSLDPSEVELGPTFEVLGNLTYSPAERLQRIQILDLVGSLLERWVRDKKIKPEDRVLIELRLLGLSYKEIAQSLGVTVSYATGRFSRLRPLLRSGLQQTNLTPTDFTDLSTT